ncbi:hypothetical protein Bca52824_073570 [Brassica carinata]|uniref:PUM-HD domain-containing protein n=1 Tax=Brassica carinata TaxID=52824 RepID=A0A8X7U6U0_BRACI|nr:hypothetical protein Bca52824_073570 [Brassica carinata]
MVFEYGNPSRRNELADQLMGQIVPLCLPLYGCEVIQKVLHIIKPDQRVRLASELDGQRHLERFPNEHQSQFITEEIHGISMHPFQGPIWNKQNPTNRF